MSALKKTEGKKRLIFAINKSIDSGFAALGWEFLIRKSLLEFPQNKDIFKNKNTFTKIIKMGNTYDKK